jgi:hypothetical protein
MSAQARFIKRHTLTRSWPPRRRLSPKKPPAVCETDRAGLVAGLELILEAHRRRRALEERTTTPITEGTDQCQEPS